MLLYLTNTIRQPTPGVADEKCNALPITARRAPEHCPVLWPAVTCGSAWLSMLTATNAAILHRSNSRQSYPSATTWVLAGPAASCKEKWARTRQPQGTSKATTRAAAAWSQQGQAGGTLPRGATPKPAGQAEDGVIFVKAENIGVFVRVVALIGMPGCRPVYRMAPHTGAMQWAHCCSPRPACPETESPEGPPLLWAVWAASQWLRLLIVLVF